MTVCVKRLASSAWAPAVAVALMFVVFSALFTIMKPLFMLANIHQFSGLGAGAWWAVIAHGFAMDMTVGAYLTILPALMAAARVWWRGRGLMIAARCYCVLMAIVVGGIVVTDAALYPYWGFRLDLTPIFYFTTSPSAVIGGLSTGQLVGGTTAWVVISFLLWLAFDTTLRRLLGFIGCRDGSRVAATVVAALATAALFVPIRGGFTVSTMNPSRAYFSDEMRLNHAALNPAFNLLYSATHQHNQSRQFRTMDTDEAWERVNALNSLYFAPDSVGPEPLLAVDRPDIFLIILESFSTHLMPSQGGEPIALRLDSIAAEGLVFTNFYANSFRTDRALASILCSFPAMPTASVMKRVDKIERLPSWTRELKRNGYDAAYYYGGDVNFTNMKALLVSGGFSNLVCDSDFPMSERLGKWGAHDNALLRRVKSDLAAAPASQAPLLRVIQTSSSHEPFEVPFNKLADPAANAFAFTDSVVGDFVDHLRRSPRWERTLVVLVADHFGCYPHDLTDPQERHHVPLVMTGGALRRKGTVETLGTQVDLAATLLSALSLDSSFSPYTHDLLSTGAGGYAFFTDAETATLLTPDGRMVDYLRGDADGNADLLPPVQALLQLIYEDYDN